LAPDAVGLSGRRCEIMRVPWAGWRELMGKRTATLQIAGDGRSMNDWGCQEILVKTCVIAGVGRR
jgi:hypothetical protein